MKPKQPKQQERSRYDQTRRRRSLRRGKERGVWVFLPALELRRAGVDPAGPPPDYRTWGQERGSILVRLYGRREAA